MTGEAMHANEQGALRRSVELLARPVKVLGLTALSALAGYGLAKGVETFVVPVEPHEVYEYFVAAGSALVGGCLSAEIIDS